jgi:hypothetical protein
VAWRIVLLVWSGGWFHVDRGAGGCYEWLICGCVWSGEWFYVDLVEGECCEWLICGCDFGISPFCARFCARAIVAWCIGVGVRLDMWTESDRKCAGQLCSR